MQQIKQTKHNNLIKNKMNDDFNIQLLSELHEVYAKLKNIVSMSESRTYASTCDLAGMKAAEVYALMKTKERVATAKAALRALEESVF